MAKERVFETEVRRWLKTNCPPSLYGYQKNIWGGRRVRDLEVDTHVWQRRMAAKGWTVPEWPPEFGGAGLTIEEAKILAAVMRDLRCPQPLFEFGVTLLGPTLMAHATNEQKTQHLPEIAAGNIRWCQAFSEPAAGSDLASLGASAERRDDRYVLNGHKVWSTLGHHADWAFCLFRTSRDAPKHQGISLLLVDLESPGITVEPITLINGNEDFCEIFFDDVEVPIDSLVGLERDGWSYAKEILARERTAIATSSSSNDLVGEGTSESLLDLFTTLHPDPSLDAIALRDEIVDAEMDQACLWLASKSNVRGHPAAWAATLKVFGTELIKRRCDLRVRTMGCQGLGWDGELWSPEEHKLARQALWARALSIVGGTTEIQLNIIAKRALELPESDS